MCRDSISHGFFHTPVLQAPHLIRAPSRDSDERLLRDPIGEGARLAFARGAAVTLSSRSNSAMRHSRFGSGLARSCGSEADGRVRKAHTRRLRTPTRLRPISLERLYERMGGGPPTSKPVPFAGEVSAHFLENTSSCKFLRGCAILLLGASQVGSRLGPGSLWLTKKARAGGSPIGHQFGRIGLRCWLTNRATPINSCNRGLSYCRRWVGAILTPRGQPSLASRG
jgi:hypothetical protein